MSHGFSILNDIRTNTSVETLLMIGCNTKFQLLHFTPVDYPLQFIADERLLQMLCRFDVLSTILINGFSFGL